MVKDLNYTKNAIYTDGSWFNNGDILEQLLVNKNYNASAAIIITNDHENGLMIQ